VTSAIPFNLVPVNFRVPGVYAEFDSSQAVTGLPGLEHRVLLIVQRRSTGTIPALQLVEVFGKEDGRIMFGEGSVGHHMVERARDQNVFARIFAIALDDNGSGTNAAGNVIWSGPATASGTISLLIGGRLVQVGIASGDTGANIATKVVAAVNVATAVGVTAAVNGSDTARSDFTSRHKGEVGNELDIRLNYQPGETLPTGVTATVTQMTGGATNPAVSSALAAIAGEWFHVIAMPYKDGANLAALEAELADRFGPIQQRDGVAILFKDDTVGNLTTFGNGRNSPHLSTAGLKSAPTPDYEIAAGLAAIVAEESQRDPARPITDITVRGVLGPKSSDRFSITEKNSLLFDGISTLETDVDGTVRIERLITMFQTAPGGIPSESYLDLETMNTLRFLRFSLRARFRTKFSRYKLADDGTLADASQLVLTPKAARAEVIVLFREWEAAGLVEGFEQFKRDLRVARNPTDKNRLDILLPPDLINQVRVIAGNFQFRR
jgi:phage tail sheath gpL-like